MANMLFDPTIDALERQRETLRQNIRAQQRLLDDIRERIAAARGELAQVEEDRLAQLTADYDRQYEELAEWHKDSRAGLLRRLRAQLPEIVASGGELPNLRQLCARSAIER